MGSLSKFEFKKQAEHLAEQPTNYPLVSIQKVADGSYKLCVLFYVPTSTEDFKMQLPDPDAQVQTEAGEVNARVFIINGTIMQAGTSTYDLILLELDYQIDTDESKPFVEVKVVLSYHNGYGPETPRGTVTTPTDPNGPTLPGDKNKK